MAFRGKKEIFLRKWFDETVMVPFEKYQFRVPKDYDEVCVIHMVIICSYHRKRIV